MSKASRRRRIAISLAVLVALLSTVQWIRMRGPTRRATEFVNAVNSGDFVRAGELFQPPDQTLPDQWAHPKHWGDDGSLFVNAYVAPPRWNELVRGIRVVSVQLILDTEPPRSTLQHTFEVSSTTVRRVSKAPDSILYPIALKPLTDPVPPIPQDIADIRAVDVRIADDDMKRYFLIGNADAQARLPKGRRLLVVLPGGNGSAAFSPFIRRIYQQVLNDDWLVAQMIAPVWERRQPVVWPRGAQPHPSARFTTEEQFDDVVDDVERRSPIDRDQIYILAWSSGGPVAYAIALRERPRVAGALIAMSIFSAREASSHASPVNTAFYLLQSPDDKTTRFQHAEAAHGYLGAAGARVKLVPYSGGHGWHGNVFMTISNGIEWLLEPHIAANSAERHAEQSNSTEPATSSNSYEN